jgi:hypothetical protein
MADSVGEALPREMTRIRKLLPNYERVAPFAPGARITIALMNASLDRAQAALASGDVIKIIRAYEDLKGYES